MPTLDADSLLSDPAPIWFDEPAAADDLLVAGPDPLQAALATLEAQARRPALAAVPPPPADPLAQALPWLVRHLGVAAAVEAVVGPVDDERPAASDTVLPALRRIGFDALLQRRSLSSFGKADLPTVLMLHSGDACVLTARWQDAQGQAQCNLVLPGPQPDEFSTAEAEIEAEYSGVALVVTRPARPPLASALARARAAATGPLAARPMLAAEVAPRAQADALVALAAAVQGAQRAMHAMPADAPAVRPPAGPARPPSPMASSMASAIPRPAPGLAAASLLVSAPATTPAAAPDQDRAALRQLSFMQADRAVITPGQALARMALDGRALVRGTLAPVRRWALAAMQALGQGAGAAGRHLAGLSRAVSSCLLRAARQAALGPGQRAWRGLRLLAFRARQQGQHWRQIRRRRQLHGLAQAALRQPGQARPAEPSWRPSASVAGPAPAVQQAVLQSAQPAVLQAASQAEDTAPARPTQAAVLPLAAKISKPGILPAWAEALGPILARAAARVLRRPAGAQAGRVAQRLAGAAACLRQARLPGLAGASALCLLVGAPQAWAAMVSATSLQALQATPQLLRGAFSANLEQAGEALATQGLARAMAARNRIDCELGQPQLAALASLGLPDEPARPAQAGRACLATGAAALAGLAPASTHAVRGRGLPRRARHAGR